MPFDTKSGRILREVATQAIVPGGSFTALLDKGYDLMSLVAHITGTITIGTAVATALKEFGMANIVDQMELFSDGKRTYEVTNGKLAMFANFERNGQRFVTDPGLTVAVHPVEAIFYFDRGTMNGARPKDSALHTSIPYMSLLQARFKWGALTDILTPGGTTVLSSDLTLHLYQDEIEERDEADAVEGKFVRISTLQEVDVTADNSNLRVKLPVGNWLAGVKLIAVNDTGAVDDTVINSVKIQNRQDVRLNTSWGLLRRVSDTENKLAIADRKVGVAYADLIHGNINKLYDLRNATQADLVLDVTKPAGGNGKIYANIIEYIEQPAVAA